MNEGKWEWVCLPLRKGEISASPYLPHKSGHTASIVCLAEISGDAAALGRAFWKRRCRISKWKRDQGAEPLGAGSLAQPSGSLDGAGRVCPTQKCLQSRWWRKTAVETGEEILLAPAGSEIFLAHICCSFIMSLTREKRFFPCFEH